MRGLSISFLRKGLENLSVGGIGVLPGENPPQALGVLGNSVHNQQSQADKEIIFLRQKCT